jgi:hypothetical protein
MTEMKQRVASTIHKAYPLVRLLALQICYYLSVTFFFSWGTCCLTTVYVEFLKRDVLTNVIMKYEVFFVVIVCNWEEADVSEEHIASIFMVGNIASKN